MAEGLLGAQLPGVRVRSAGLGALVGHPADVVAIKLLRQRGIDITAHRAAQISRQLCLDSDVVLVMESDQRKRLQEMYPEARGRVFRVCEFTESDVLDPYRGPEEAFQQALSLIEAGVTHWVQRIQKL
jgi:protein-tyrosine phosphatase